MTLRRLISRSLWTHRRAHAAVALGTAIATTVLVGALVVGDSVRGSLRGRALDRLGDVGWAVTPPRPFRAELAGQTSPSAGRAAVIAPATLSARGAQATRRASGVTLYGGVLPEASEPGVAWLAEPVAAELGVEAGDSLVVRVATRSAVPGESPLGEKDDTTRSMRFRDVRVIEPAGMARFSLDPSQSDARSLFIALADAQSLLELGGEATALLFTGDAAPELRPALADYGLRLLSVGGARWQLESDNLVLSEAALDAAAAAFGDDSVQPATTYLANRIEAGGVVIPYSTVTGAGVSGGASIVDLAGRPITLADDEIALNDWAASDLNVAVGDPVTLRFYEPESTHGVLSEAAPVTLRLAAIAPLTDSRGEATAAADERWTPELDGVTDAQSINDWDLPFELVESIRPQDEDYWDEHGATPKAFVSEPLARRLWGSRWGDTSLVRFQADGDRESVERRLLAAIDPEAFGFVPVDLRQQAIAASSGSTPFDVLFLLFSMFLIASALGLISLLVRLALDARMSEPALLGAVGFPPQRVRRAMLAEVLLVVAVGATLGAFTGVAYAALLLWALRTVWIDAVTTPFLQLHAGPATIAAGALLGFFVAGLTAWRAVRTATRTPPRQALLGGGSMATHTARFASWSPWIAVALLACGVAAGLVGRSLRGEAAAGAFFAAGAATLAALLVGLYGLLGGDGRSRPVAPGFVNLVSASLARHAGRSLLVVGLVGAATFLVLATSAFRLSPATEGTGGFDLVGQADQSLIYDLGDPEGRFQLGFSGRDEEELAGWRVVGMRVQPGEDASCRNLYQTRRPRVLGVPADFSRLAGEFSWAESAAPDSPWSVLPASATAPGGPLPVVLDFNTAVYSLKLYGGVGSRFSIEGATGEPVDLVVAGLLKNSVLQGDVLIGEADFKQRYPRVSGDRLFLLAAPEGARDPDQVIGLLEDRLSDFGFDAEPSITRLARFLAVQNTYLSTFQTLGALGLALGVVGLAVAQYRNLTERRGELALMRAAGFSAGRLGRLASAETLVLLSIGLLFGAAAAFVALAPLSAAVGAKPPWIAAAALAAVLLLVAIVAGRVAVRAVLKAPITTALRGD